MAPLGRPVPPPQYIGEGAQAGLEPVVRPAGRRQFVVPAVVLPRGVESVPEDLLAERRSALPPSNGTPPPKAPDPGPPALPPFGFGRLHLPSPTVVAGAGTTGGRAVRG